MTDAYATPNPWEKMVMRNTILRGVVGSTIHGLNVSDAREDRDEMGVCIEPIQHALGLSVFEQYIYRSAAVREGDHNARSRAGDLDLTIYSLRKFVRLALKGNPTILTLLFVPPEQCSVLTAAGHELQALAPYIVSRRAGRAFLGYLNAQKSRFLGERGGTHGRLRPDYDTGAGYDTKYAMHMLRLGFQGIELLTTGKLSLPMLSSARDFLLAVRRGDVSIERVQAQAENLERELKDLLDTSVLPEGPDEARVENWMIGRYEQRVVDDVCFRGGA